MGDAENLLSDMKRARQEMEHLLQHVFGQSLPLLRPIERKWRPNADVFECGDRIVAIVELAGVEKADVSVTFHEGKLYLTGTRKDLNPYKSRKYCQMEISYNDFERVIFLPDDIDVEKITAKLNDGIMTIEAPKKAKQPPTSQNVKIEE